MSTVHVTCSSVFRCFSFAASLAALTCLFAPSPAAARTAAEHLDTGICEAHAAHSEQTYGIPHGLLQAIARTESGRWAAQTGLTSAWPWTVRDGERSYHFESREEAETYLFRRGEYEPIALDVGCMQINLHYHGEAFGNVIRMIEPAENVRYAAAFLVSLYQMHGDWDVAIARYHSGSAERGAAYRDRVFSRLEAIVPTSGYLLAGLSGDRVLSALSSDQSNRSPKDETRRPVEQRPVERSKAVLPRVVRLAPSSNPASAGMIRIAERLAEADQERPIVTSLSSSSVSRPLRGLVLAPDQEVVPVLAGLPPGRSSLNPAVPPVLANQQQSATLTSIPVHVGRPPWLD